MKKNKNINFINWVGVYTLFAKETKRFCKVYQQTILAPAFTSLLFFLVISVGNDILLLYILYIIILIK